MTYLRRFLIHFVFEIIRLLAKDPKRFADIKRELKI